MMSATDFFRTRASNPSGRQELSQCLAEARRTLVTEQEKLNVAYRELIAEKDALSAARADRAGLEESYLTTIRYHESLVENAQKPVNKLEKSISRLQDSIRTFEDALAYNNALGQSMNL